MLLPELFGVYALALSIVTIALTFTDLGMGATATRYISDALGRERQKKARSYTRYFLKIKSFLILIAVILLIMISKYLSYTVYKNPLIYYPLLFSCLLILSEAFREFFSLFFVVEKNLKPITILDLILQISKISFSVLALLIFINDFKVIGLFIAFFLSSLMTLLISLLILFKKNKFLFFGKTQKINKRKIKSYWKYMALATLSLAFFGSIDTLMLGGFVSSEYLGYYRASLSLILAVTSILSVSGILLPIFTQIHKKRFIRGFHKTIRLLLIIAIPSTVGIVFLARYLIFLVYGTDYLPATSSVYFLSLLVFTTPLIALYSMILESKEKPKIVSNAVIISLVTNVILNYIAIKTLISDPILVIGGVGAATALSRVILLGILVYYSRKDLGFQVGGLGLRKPILSTLALGGFLFVFNLIFDINIFTGILEVVLGSGIYFGALILMKGIGKEDWKLLKGLIKNKD